MEILNFSNTPKQSFIHGFLMGLASPVMLFGSFATTTLQQVRSITLPSSSTDHALENDWKKIAMDFNNVVINYGKSIETPSQAGV